MHQVSSIHRGVCTALCVTRDRRYIITAGDNSIKVWAYSMSLDLNFQVFVGHSEPISQLLVTPNGAHLISSADGIFFWDFLAPPLLPTSHPPTSTSPTLPLTKHHTSMFSVSPRVGPPAPTNFEPLNNHVFTPLPGAPSEKKSVRISTLKKSTEYGDDSLHCDSGEVRVGRSKGRGGEGEVRGRGRGRERGEGREVRGGGGEEEDISEDGSGGNSGPETDESSDGGLEEEGEHVRGSEDVIIEHVSSENLPTHVQCIIIHLVYISMVRVASSLHHIHVVGVNSAFYDVFIVLLTLSLPMKWLK